MLKRQRIESDAIRKAARAEQCTLQIVGVCNYDTATTVLAHLPDASHGMGYKADDVSACMACSACHAVIDGDSTKWPPGEYARRDWYMRRAMVETWRRLVEQGVVTIKGVRP